MELICSVTRAGRGCSRGASILALIISVAGRSERPFTIALSVLATQCSTNSILGAPAFVAFVAGGGLVWLQYELAVPLAMIFTMIFVIPIFQRLQLVSVYEYLERRYDLKTRLLLSGVFQVLRLLAAAVTIYGVSAMIDLITGIGFSVFCTDIRRIYRAL